MVWKKASIRFHWLTRLTVLTMEKAIEIFNLKSPSYPLDSIQRLEKC